VARAGLDEARRSVLNLRAAPGGGTPLPEALAALGRDMAAETGVRVHVRTAGGRPVPQALEAELFRIAQEALTNVRRHANATEAAVTLASTPRGIRLSIHDDGKGFAPRKVPAGRLGLVGMRERAELLGGRFRVSSSPRRGTTVTVAVPDRRGVEPAPAAQR
ncbi:MAG TPA: ATP-binding protein, partial [bacterium]|nr:ATP-binding protein [bacterium]